MILDVLKNFEAVKERVTRAPEKFHLPSLAESPQIIAVSKTHPAEKVLPLLEDGHRVFGENRVQEAAAKWPSLRQKYTDIELHMIGPLQTNKVKEALRIFDVIQTVDREKLARAIAKELSNEDSSLSQEQKSEQVGEPALSRRDSASLIAKDSSLSQEQNKNFFIQVNIGQEEQKAGIAPAQADEFIKYCRDELKLPVIGLMCIPPVEEEAAPYFALLKKIAERNGVEKLSMGMSGDFELAASMGATHIRIGTAIFGGRG